MAVSIAQIPSTQLSLLKSGAVAHMRSLMDKFVKVDPTAENLHLQVEILQEIFDYMADVWPLIKTDPKSDKLVSVVTAKFAEFNSSLERKNANAKMLQRFNKSVSRLSRIISLKHSSTHIPVASYTLASNNVVVYRGPFLMV
jgi:hypothetical protein